MWIAERAPCVFYCFNFYHLVWTGIQMVIKTLVEYFLGHCISHILQTSPKVLKKLLVQKELFVYLIVWVINITAIIREFYVEFSYILMTFAKEAKSSSCISFFNITALKASYTWNFRICEWLLDGNWKSCSCISLLDFVTVGSSIKFELGLNEPIHIKG